MTGKLGDVMKESAQAALTYVRSRAEELGIPEDIRQSMTFICMFEGAIPKDGPSVGITIAVALASAMSGKLVRKDVAMTGEITLGAGAAYRRLERKSSGRPSGRNSYGNNAHG